MTPTLVSAHQQQHGRIGRCHHLRAENALAFSMATHPRLGAGCVYEALMPELVAQIIELAHSWPRRHSFDEHALLRLVGGSVVVPEL